MDCVTARCGSQVQPTKMTLARQRVLSSSEVRASDLEHGGPWVRISSGAGSDSFVEKKVQRKFVYSRESKDFSARRFLDRIGIWKCWFLLRRGETRSTRRKTSRSKGENQTNDKLNPHVASMPGFVHAGPRGEEGGGGGRARVTLVGSRSALTTTPPFPPKQRRWVGSSFIQPRRLEAGSSIGPVN